jgi:hypothetical protein
MNTLCTNIKRQAEPSLTKAKRASSSSSSSSLAQNHFVKKLNHEERNAFENSFAKLINGLVGCCKLVRIRKILKL